MAYPGAIMKLALVLPLVLAAFVGAARAEEADEIRSASKIESDNFNARMYAGPAGSKAYACFVRRYDANHLAQHPKQKVSAMKLLVTAENPPEEKITNYSFRIGVKYRHRSGNFDSSGYCNHVNAEDKGNEIRFGCGVDCDGGGIAIAMKDDKSAVIQLERIRIWERNKPDDDASNDLVAGADDKIFRVDRAELREYAELVTDRKELAALRHK